jgi:PH (Pleckstrin Homology) domain-containing protein
MDAASNNENLTATFKASRWTRDNFLFPTRIEVGPERVLRIKPRFFGRTEESIPITKVASVQIESGMVWSNIRIDSSGGTNPILSHGHHKKDAERIRQLIEQYQTLPQRGPAV